MTTSKIKIYEDLLASEATRQGLIMSGPAMTAAALVFAGSTVEGDIIVMPDRRSLHVRDAVRSLKDAHPEKFRSIEKDQPTVDHAFTGLTKAYFEENRRAQTSGKPNSRRYTGKTAEMMAEIAASKRGAE